MPGSRVLGAAVVLAGALLAVLLGAGSVVVVEGAPAGEDVQALSAVVAARATARSGRVLPPHRAGSTA
jgi:hypothetical protein